VKKVIYITLVLNSLFLINTNSQTDSMIWISGTVVDSASHTPVPFANIASYSQHQLFAANAKGHFYIQLPKHDSIKIVVMGYGVKVFRLDSLTETEAETYVFPVSRKSIMLKKIDITLKSGYFDDARMNTSKGIMDNLNLPADIIPYDKSKDIIPASAKPVFKYDPPPIAFFFHPVSYINYFAGKQQKEKRKMVKLIKQGKSREIMSRDMIEDLSGLSGDSLESFIIFCNENIDLQPKDDEVSIRRKVFFALEGFLSKDNGIR